VSLLTTKASARAPWTGTMVTDRRTLATLVVAVAE
jgi:hypothetical protein